MNIFDVFSEEVDGYYYHTYDSVQELMSIYDESKYVQKSEIGYSNEGRNIYLVKLSDFSVPSENKKKILLVGGTHAREIMSVEVPLYFIEYFICHSGDEDLMQLLKEYEIWVVPMLNPDGHVRVENGEIFWRKNVKDTNGDGVIWQDQDTEQGDGVDLNRNFGYQWGIDDVGSSPDSMDSCYRGVAAFSEPETQAIQSITSRESGNEFLLVLSYHSYGNFILYPWSYTIDLIDNFFLYNSLSMTFDNILTGSYFKGSISLMHLQNGVLVDYSASNYDGKSPSISFTFELNNEAEGGFSPSVEYIPQTAEEHFGVLMYLLNDGSDKILQNLGTQASATDKNLMIS
ncbi:MAG: hypothetical protein KKF44_08775 [Nanoarchaeota archaeon]|nr:hypothetical protein [Nanoarchaeota archaeon]